MELEEGGGQGEEADQAVPMDPAPSEETGEGQDAETARRVDMRARNRIASVEHRKRRKVRRVLKMSGPGDADMIVFLWSWCMSTMACIPGLKLTTTVMTKIHLRI